MPCSSARHGPIRLNSLLVDVSALDRGSFHPRFASWVLTNNSVSRSIGSVYITAPCLYRLLTIHATASLVFPTVGNQAFNRGSSPFRGMALKRSSSFWEISGRPPISTALILPALTGRILAAASSRASRRRLSGKRRWSCRNGIINRCVCHRVQSERRRFPLWHTNYRRFPTTTTPSSLSSTPRRCICTTTSTTRPTSTT